MVAKGKLLNYTKESHEKGVQCCVVNLRQFRLKKILTTNGN